MKINEGWDGWNGGPDPNEKTPEETAIYPCSGGCTGIQEGSGYIRLKDGKFLCEDCYAEMAVGANDFLSNVFQVDKYALAELLGYFWRTATKGDDDMYRIMSGKE